MDKPIITAGTVLTPKPVPNATSFSVERSPKTDFMTHAKCLRIYEKPRNARMNEYCCGEARNVAMPQRVAREDEDAARDGLRGTGQPWFLRIDRDGKSIARCFRRA